MGVVVAAGNVHPVQAEGCMDLYVARMEGAVISEGRGPY